MQATHSRTKTNLKASAAPVWTAQPGAQEMFLQCPFFEVLLEGTRGGGKTDALVMDFLQHVGVGWGGEWRGILFRQSFPQLADVIKKTRKWFPMAFPGAKYNKQDHCWTFPDGEELLLRHINDPEDYWNYHGHEYPWIGWEELTNWRTDECYRRMMSCCRSSVGPDRRDSLGRPMPRKYRATTNPYGPGHNWIKRRFRLPQMRGCVIREEEVFGEEGVSIREIRSRVAIHSRVTENKVLLSAEPDYVEMVVRQAARNESERKAWEEGSWDITSGGMFDDLWDPLVHVIEDFDPPKDWKMSRSLDWGSARPASVGWWAEADGTPLLLPSGRVLQTVRGDKFRVAEWYICGAEPNTGLRLTAAEIAAGIVQREIALGWRPRDGSRPSRVKAGAADAQIWDGSGGPSVAVQFQQPVRIDGRTYKGLQWLPSEKGRGSRRNGWQAIRDRLEGAVPPPEGLRERPGLFITRSCKKFQELVPSLARDLKDPEDIDTDDEDHMADEVRYEIMTPRRTVSSGYTTGLY